MPPKKKKKKNIVSDDTDSQSGGPSDSDAQKGRVRKKATGVSQLTTQQQQQQQQQQHVAGKDQSSEQVMAFVSEQELAKYARPLGIRRLMLADLCQQSDLEGRYVGGQVISTCSMPYSQGHDLSIFIQDESTTHNSQYKHLKVTISDKIGENMPSLRDDAKLFLHKAEVVDNATNDFSQDHAKCLVVDGEEVRVWIVHRDARESRFFTQTSCGKKWWKKTKKKRVEMELKSAALATNKAHMVASSTDQRQEQREENMFRSQEDSSFPDNSDFPDSAFMEDSKINAAASLSSSSSSGDNETSSSSCESDREWTAKHRASSEQSRKYDYKKLADLNIGDNKMNTFGVVKEFKPPTLTRGSDYYSTMTLVDESDPKVGVRCITFNSVPNKLPQIKREGDVVCLHRVNVTSYQCQPQLQGLRYSSSIRFSGELHKKMTPHTGSVSFTCTLLERERVKELRQWARNLRKEKLSVLESITLDSYLDLVCQIVSVTISKVPRCVVLTIWDATPRNFRCKNISLEKCYEEGYPIVKEDPDLLDFSSGCEADVVIYNKSIIKKASMLRPRQFVYLSNVYSTVADSESDLIELSIPVQREGIPYPKLEVLSSEDELCRDVEKRVKELTTPVTITRHQKQPVCTIKEIISYDRVHPAKFRCRAKVLTILAPSLEDMVLIHCKRCGRLEVLTNDKEIDSNGTSKEACPACSESGSHTSPSYPSCQYYFKMTLRDKTGEINVDVAHEQALKLFNNLKPVNFYQNQELRYQLMRSVYALTGNNNPFDGSGSFPRPQVDCSVLTVNHDGSIYHCLFDTKLK